MHGHTASPAPWGTASSAQSNLHVGYLRNEVAEPGIEEEYPNFSRTFPPHAAVSLLAQQSLGQFHRLSLCALGL